ncbi:hypothetical protein [Paenibacillus sp. HJGM_3]|uniref:hypothetical protein n=1 Tax=Paenibacillus sp. HJGM_3 TaxID=3379816 RepID=UPI00385B3CEF
MIIDRYMPNYQFCERHSVIIRANREEVYHVIKLLKPTDTPLIRLLFGIRMLPTVLAGHLTEARKRFGRIKENHAPPSLLDNMKRTGFILLEEDPGCEMVVGVIGQFWKPILNKPVELDSAAEFLEFDDLTYAKGVMNVILSEPRKGETLVLTETRVCVKDPTIGRRFALYWKLIYPGCALIRRMMLHTIKIHAESGRGKRNE